MAERSCGWWAGRRGRRALLAVLGGVIASYGLVPPMAGHAAGGDTVLLPGTEPVATRAVTLVLRYTVLPATPPPPALLAAVSLKGAAFVAWTVPDMPAGLPAPQTGDPRAPGFVHVPDSGFSPAPCAGTVVADATARTITLTPTCATPQVPEVLYGNVDLPDAAGKFTFPARTSVSSLLPTADQALTLVALDASALAFSEQPSAARAGNTLPPVAVQLEDRFGNAVTGSDRAVLLTLQRADGSRAPLYGQTEVLSHGGIAVFTGMRIDQAAGGYTLTAGASGLQSATSEPFDVVAGTPSILAFSTQPGGGVRVGEPFPQQPVISVTDGNGNAVDVTSVITLAIAPGTAPPDAHLICDGGTTRTASHGVATFSGCAIDSAAGGVTLTATTGEATRAVSDAFDVAAVVVPPPPEATTGARWIPAVAGGGGVALLVAAVFSMRAWQHRLRRRLALRRVRVEPHVDTGRWVLREPHPVTSHRVTLVPRAGTVRVLRER